jgi:STE24 endopeptidase
MNLNHWRRFPADAVDYFDREEIERGRAYNRPLERLRLVRTALTTAVVLAFIAGDNGPKVIDKLDLRGWAWNVLLVATVFALVESIVSWWFDAFRELVWDKRWELSTQTVGGFVADQAKNTAVGLVLNAVLFVPLWAVIRASDLWWLWGWLLFSGFTVLFGLLYPIVIAPVFNKFTPLEGGEVRDRIMAVAAKTGLPINEVLVADASRRSNAGNAYVAGLGTTRRVVVFDTILDWPLEEIEQVVAHELGHWKHAHLRRKLPVLIGTQLLMFVVTYLVLQWDWLLHAGGVQSVRDPAALPIFLFVFPLGFVLVGAVTSYLSRVDERQADLYALEVLDDPGQLSAMFRRLAEANKADVDPPLLKRIMASHPPIPERLAMADAWSAGA